MSRARSGERDRVDGGSDGGADRDRAAGQREGQDGQHAQDAFESGVHHVLPSLGPSRPVRRYWPRLVEAEVEWRVEIGVGTRFC